MLLLFCIEYYFSRKIVALTHKYNKALEKSSGIYYESTNNILSIKSMGAKDSLKNNVQEYEKKALEFSLDIRDVGLLKWKCFQTLIGVSLISFLMLIGYSVVNGSITVGFVLVFFNYFDRLRTSALDITKLNDRVIASYSAVKRVMPIFDEVEQKYFGEDDFPKWNKINLDDVFFSYASDNEDMHLENINMKIKRNEKIGLVGSSGSGKSTFAKILIGLYKINKGNISVENKNFYDIRRNEITKNISIVLQESELFNMSLRDNITTLKNVDDKLLKLAIEISQLEPIIKKLPNGLDTIIGEKGYRLSGGEKQRVGIARAIVKNSPILILDEATSALDSRTEKKIQNAIDEKLKNKTILIVAHRLSTLKNVDKVIVFEKGKIVESGGYDNLLKNKKSKFRKLWELQNS